MPADPLDPAPLDITLLATDDPRLGRHRVHDERSRGYDLSALIKPRPRPRPVSWARGGPLFDQSGIDPGLLQTLGADPTIDSIGCCTMCAAFGLLSTEPFARPGRSFSMRDVLVGYHLETQLDEPAVPGVWPPADTGSSELYAMKVLQAGNLISSYRHAFTFAAVHAALRVGPVACGTNWYDSMFTPVSRGGRQVLEISPNAQVAGGHEWIIDRDDPDTQLLGMTNSWGEGWGDHGRAWMSYTTFDRLRCEGGDVTQPVVPMHAASR